MRPQGLETPTVEDWVHHFPITATASPKLALCQRFRPLSHGFRPGPHPHDVRHANLRMRRCSSNQTFRLVPAARVCIADRRSAELSWRLAFRGRAGSTTLDQSKPYPRTGAASGMVAPRFEWPKATLGALAVRFGNGMQRHTQSKTP